MKFTQRKHKTGVRTELLYGIVIVLILSTACNLPALMSKPASPALTPADLQVTALDLLDASSKTTPEMYFDHGFPRSVLLDVPVAGADSVEKTRNYLATYRDLYLQSNPDLALNVLRISGENDQNVVFYQTYKGLPVYASEISVLLNDDHVRATTGALLNSYVNLNILPGISDVEAEALARVAIKQPEASVIGKTTLLIFDQSLFNSVPSSPYLAWKVTLDGGKPRQVFIDAKKGETLFEASLSESGDYDYEEWDAAGDNSYDSNCYWDSGPHSIGDEDGIDDDYMGDIDATSAYEYAKGAYFFFQNVFGMNNDDFGGQIEVGIHANVDNALWRHGCDIAEFRNGWVGYDVMVHELTHGIVAHKSMFESSYQPGALNESIADVMGVYADPGDWLVGEDRTNGEGAIRDLSNSDRDMLTDYKTYPVDDNYGVHDNSTIFSKAAFLLGCDENVDDLCGFHNGWTVYPIGRDKMAVLFFQTLIYMVPGNAQFVDAASVAIALANIWADNGYLGFTKDDACQVRNAFAAVELAKGDYGCDGTIDGFKDTDNDHVLDKDDNCINVKNPFQMDSDGDGVGNSCEEDDDNDGVKDYTDNCVLVANPSQQDSSHNGKGDVCDNSDGDSFLDSEDNCMYVDNPTQANMDGDAVGDACDSDIDGDKVINENDDCVLDPDPDQLDTDHDGEGNVCDVDTDQDGISTNDDNCPFTPNPKQENSDGDGAGDACDPTPSCNDVKAWSSGFQIGEDFISPHPLVDPLACTPESITPSITLKPGRDSDGEMHPVDIPGVPGKHLTLLLPDCEQDKNGWYSPDWRGLLILDGLDRDIRFKIVDSDGNLRSKDINYSTGANGASDGQIQVFVKPQPGRMTYLDILLPQDYANDGRVGFGAEFICGPKAELSNWLGSTSVPGEVATIDPALTPVANLPAPTITPTLASVVERSCTWTAAINIFVRQGPGSSHYEDIWSYTPNQSAPVIGQSADGYWWALQTSGGTGYVPKEPRFGTTSGLCEGLPTLQAPPTITPTVQPANPEVPSDPGAIIPTATVLPQCSDRIDNDGDGRMDMDDSQCRNTNDNDEANR